MTSSTTAAATFDDDDDDAHNYVYHEKQESSLCGQHALNALLIGPYFTPFDLAEIAAELDAKERELMLAAGETEEALKFLAEDSGNVNARYIYLYHSSWVATSPLLFSFFHPFLFQSDLLITLLFFLPHFFSLLSFYYNLS